MNKKNLLFTLFASVALGQLISANAADPVESDYYQIDRLPIPEGVVLETSGIEMLPNGKLAVCGRRGNVYVLSNPFGKTEEIKWPL